MSDPTPTEASEISQDSRGESGAPAHITPSEALQFLRDGLPADRGLDGERDTAIRTLCEAELVDFGALKAAADATPQPPTRVLWSTSTEESNDRWLAEEGKSFLGDGIQLDVPPGTRVVVIEVAATMREGTAERLDVYPVTWRDEDGEEQNTWSRNPFTDEIERDLHGAPLYTTVPPLAGPVDTVEDE